MADETDSQWEARQVDEARLAAARWAIELVDSHPELLDLVPPEKRRLYLRADDE